ncbi:MAG: hypothetical protein ACLTQL_13710 [Eisenbergiella sp.]
MDSESGWQTFICRRRNRVVWKKKRSLSGKTVLKIIGAVVSALFFGLYVYAGISRVESMQEEVHVMQRGDMKIWLAGCLSSSLVLRCA